LHKPPATSRVPDMHIEHWWRSLKSTGAIGFSVYVALMNLVVAVLHGLHTARRVRELRKPRRSLSAPALVMRVTGLNSRVGFVYDFIGRPAPDLEERAPPLEKRDNGE
jgi:hypothetical protein